MRLPAACCLPFVREFMLILAVMMSQCGFRLWAQVKSFGFVFALRRSSIDIFSHILKTDFGFPVKHSSVLVEAWKLHSEDGKEFEEWRIEKSSIRT